MLRELDYKIGGMEMDKVFKVGLVGAGGVTQLHLDGYKNHPERVEVVAICDPNEEVLNKRADEYGIKHRFTDLQDFIENSHVDVAVVCTPTSVRKEVLFPIIEAGIPIFVEKPFSDTLTEAAAIVDKASKAKLPMAVNQNFRRHYPFELIRGIVKENAIGKISQIMFTEIFFRQDAGWRLNNKRHALSVMGIHWLDGFRLVLDANPVTIACQTRSSSAINCAGETEATVQIAFDNDAIVTYVQSFSSSFSKNEMIVIGEKGTIVANHTSVKLYQRGQAEPIKTWKHHISREEATFGGLNQLLMCIESGHVPTNNVIDNLKTVSLLAGAYQAAEENSVISFDAEGLLQNEISIL